MDTLPAFQEFFSDTTEVIQPAIPLVPEGRDEVDEEELAILKTKRSDTSLDDNWDDALCSVLDDIEKVSTPNTRTNSPSDAVSCENGKDVLDAITKSNHQASNSGTTTPKISPTSMQAVNETTPESQIIRNSSTNSTSGSSSARKLLNAARKQLNFGDSKPKNFKLATVHMHMVGCEAENQHCAEADCISMLRCVCQIGPHFAEWADCNAVSVNLFKKK